MFLLLFLLLFAHSKTEELILQKSREKLNKYMKIIMKTFRLQIKNKRDYTSLKSLLIYLFVYFSVLFARRVVTKQKTNSFAILQTI